MLDRLDDAQPFRPDERFRRAVERRARHLRRRRRAAASTLALTVLAGGVGAGALYVDRRDAAIDRIEVITQPSTDEATNVLLVGSDERADDAPGRADSVTVIRFEPDGSVRALFVPRDLWIPSTQTRLTDTHADGPQAVIDALADALDIPIDHYIGLDLDGLRGLIDELGGVEIAVDRPIRDAPTGLDLPASECMAISGDTLLALVRARHLEYEGPDGTWATDPTGDLGRIARAQVVMQVAVSSLAGARTDPVTLDRYSRVLADHAVLDAGLSLADLAHLGRVIASAGTARTTSQTLPVRMTVAAGGSTVLELDPAAATVLDTFRGAAPAPQTASTTPEPSVAAPIHPC